VIGAAIEKPKHVIIDIYNAGFDIYYYFKSEIFNFIVEFALNLIRHR